MFQIAYLLALCHQIPTRAVNEPLCSNHSIGRPWKGGWWQSLLHLGKLMVIAEW